MLLLFSVRIAVCPPVWERAIYLVYCGCCECLSIFPFFFLNAPPSQAKLQQMTLVFFLLLCFEERQA